MANLKFSATLECRASETPSVEVQQPIIDSNTFIHPRLDAIQAARH